MILNNFPVFLGSQTKKPKNTKSELNQKIHNNQILFQENELGICILTQTNLLLLNHLQY